MNHKFTWIFTILTIFGIQAINADDDCCGTCPTTCAQAQNLYQPHAFSVSMSRQIMLEKSAWFPMPDEEGWHGTFGAGFNYMRSFGNCGNDCCSQLGSLPFWSANNTSTMTLGSNNGLSNVDVYQLGMGPVITTGLVSLSPVVYQTGVDFLLYVGTHKADRGFFLKLHGPVGVTNINPALGYSDDLAAVAYAAGSLNNVASTVAAPYDTIKEAFEGGRSAGWLEPMVKGLISCKRTSSAHFGDLEFTLGYNVFANDTSHIGIGFIFSAPTGNKANGIYVLEPIFGRNGHWGAGAEVIAHWKFWESDTRDDKWAQLFFDGDVLHLFKSKHTRSFDLKGNGPGSKYLLLAKYIGNTAATPTEFQNSIINAVNITTVGVASTFAAEGNFALSIDAHWGAWSIELGYEGWGRTCECLVLDCSCPGSINYNQYAVLGRQTPYQTDGTTFAGLCQPSATISSSVDRADSIGASTVIKDACLAVNRLPEAAEDAFDIEGQRARAVYTSKPYVEFRYTWTDSDYVPYLALTGGAEIPNLHKNEAAKFWNVGLNGGMTF